MPFMKWCEDMYCLFDRELGYLLFLSSLVPFGFFFVFCGIIWIYSCFGVFNLWICNLKKIANQILDSRHQRVPQTRFHTWIMLHRSTLYAPDDSKLHIGIHPLYKVIHSKYLHTYYEKSGKIKKRTQLKVWKLRNDG